MLQRQAEAGTQEQEASHRMEPREEARRQVAAALRPVLQLVEPSAGVVH